MSFSRSVLALLLLGLSAVGAAAQDIVIPGSAGLRTDRILATTDTYTITNYREGKVWRASKLVRAVDRVTIDGRTLLRYAQLYDTPDGVTVDTTWVDAKTLAPVRYFAEVFGEIQQFTFTPLEARGTVTPKDSAMRTVLHQAPAPFFSAVALDLLYYALDVKDGFRATFDAYNPPRAGMRIPLAYVARERIPLVRGGDIETLKVSFGPAGTHIWLDAKTGALLINGGARAGSAFWKVRSDVDASRLVAESLK